MIGCGGHGRARILRAADEVRTRPASHGPDSRASCTLVAAIPGLATSHGDRKLNASRRDSISPRTREAFREHLVGWTLRQIDDLFGEAGVSPGELAVAWYGERRTLVECYHAGLDWSSPGDVSRARRVFEEILLTLEGPKIGPPGPVHVRTTLDDHAVAS
jgi:hypothetical protein